MTNKPPKKRRVLLLVNPAARNGMSILHAAEHMSTKSHPNITLLIPDDSSRQTQLEFSLRELRAGVDAVIVAGGDGAIHGVAHLIKDFEVPLGIIPTGSGNDFARGIGVSRRNPKRTLSRLLTAIERGRATRKLDVIELTLKHEGRQLRELRAVNSVNIGFDAAVNLRGNAMRTVPPSLRYLFALFAEIRKFVPIPFTILHENEAPRDESLTLICVQNGPFIGGGIPLAPKANPASGSLEFSTVTAVGRSTLLALFPLLMLRRNAWLTPLKSQLISQVTIDVPEGVPVCADGEELVAYAPQNFQVRIRVRPRALEILQD